LHPVNMITVQLGISSTLRGVTTATGPGLVLKES
jgi:hypothetical protein